MISGISLVDVIDGNAYHNRHHHQDSYGETNCKTYIGLWLYEEGKKMKGGGRRGVYRGKGCIGERGESRKNNARVRNDRDKCNNFVKSYGS